MKKIRVNMLSMADKVDGQGVGSAYKELVQLLRKDGKNDFEVQINKGTASSDIIHAHTIEPRNYMKMLFTKKPTIAYVHFLPNTLDGSIKLPKISSFVLNKYVIWFYKNADHLVVVNPSFKKQMVNLGLDENKIKYIPNFVSKKDFYKKDKKEINEIRKEYGLKSKDFVVLGCGQVQTRKGVLDFIDVAKKLPDIQFVWAGGFSFGKITDGHKKLAKIMENPPKNVKFIGIIPREKMNDIYNMADLLFVPSYNELFPMTILEATATETPIFLRDLDLYNEILFGEKYLRANDNKSFVKVIDEISKDKNKYNKEVENAKFIASYYSEKRVYDMWKEYYTQVLEDNKKAKLDKKNRRRKRIAKIFNLKNNKEVLI